MLDVVQHVEDDDGVDGGEGGACACRRRRCRRRRRARARARSTSRAQQLDAADADVDRRLGPVARPAALARGLRRGREQAGEQALAAADVEHARARRDQAAREQMAEDRVPAQLAAREVPGEAAGAPVGRARRASTSARHAAAASALLMATRSRARPAAASSRAHRGSALRAASPRRRPAARARSSSAGSTASTTGAAVAARAALPSCSEQDVAGARGRAPRRASTSAGSRRTVSKPRRVQLTSCRSSRCSTGARNGLRSPAGARKKRGALAGDVGERCLRGADLARHRLRARAARSACEWRSLWFCTLWPRRDDLAAQRGVRARALRRCRRRSRARRARRAGRARPA